jgi:glycosyl transferase family 11
VDPLFPDWSYRPYLSVPDGWFAGDLDAAVPAQRFSKLPHGQRAYLQQWAYVRDVMPEIQESFAPSTLGTEVLFDHLKATDQTYLLDLVADGVTLHVRRGDACDPDTHPVGSWPLVTMDYYRDALDLFDPDAPLVIFSDDPDWCRQNIIKLCPPRSGCIFVVTDGPTRSPEYLRDGAYGSEPAMDWIDLQLMAMFSRHVIANSSYSTWGALLGPGPTVYPDHWVGWRNRDSLPEESTIVPPEWVQVPNPVSSEHLDPC